MHDTWMQGISNDEMKKASLAHSLREARRKIMEDLAESQSDGSDEKTHWLKLIAIMKPRESVADVSLSYEVVQSL